MSSFMTAVALAMALLFTSSGPGPVGTIDHGEDGVWALECVYPDGIELVYVYGDHHEGQRMACPGEVLR